MPFGFRVKLVFISSFPTLSQASSLTSSLTNSQAIQLLASLPICNLSKSKLDGSFLSVTFQSFAVWSLLRAHWSLTDSCSDNPQDKEDSTSSSILPTLKREQSGNSDNSSSKWTSNFRGKDEESLIPGGWDSGNGGLMGEKGWRNGWTIQERKA